MSSLKKANCYLKTIFVLTGLLIFLAFYEDRNFLSWKETIKEAIKIWNVPFAARLAIHYQQVLKTPFNETSRLVSIAKVEKIRRQILKKGQKTVWIAYPHDSNLYADPLKLNIYQRIAEILYPVRIDPDSKYELVFEIKEDLILKLKERKINTFSLQP